MADDRNISNVTALDGTPQPNPRDGIQVPAAEEVMDESSNHKLDPSHERTPTDPQLNAPQRNRPGKEPTVEITSGETHPILVEYMTKQDLQIEMLKEKLAVLSSSIKNGASTSPFTPPTGIPTAVPQGIATGGPAAGVGSGGSGMATVVM